MIVRVGKVRKDGKYPAAYTFDNGVRINKIRTRADLDAECRRGVDVRGYLATPTVLTSNTEG